MCVDNDTEIRELISRALPANDNTNQAPSSKAVPFEKLTNNGINIVGNHNVVIEANLLVLTSCIVLLFMINLLINR